MSVSEHCGGGDAGRPLVVGTLRGYRTWGSLNRWAKVPSGSLPLTSVAQRHVVWTPTLTARCIPPESFTLGSAPSVLAHDHPSPSAGCHCGIYAWYAPDDTGILSGHIFGVIQASGVILMGDRGFRAERARITAVVTRNRRIAAACAEAGITVYRSRRKLLADHPPEDLTSLLGDEHPSDRDQLPTPRTALTTNRSLLYMVCVRSIVIVLAGIALTQASAAIAAILAQVFLIAMIIIRLR
jgi:hypothetical protein